MPEAGGFNSHDTLHHDNPLPAKDKLLDRPPMNYLQNSQFNAVYKKQVVAHLSMIHNFG